MRQLITITLSSALLSAIAFSVNAEPSTDAGIPEKVKADIIKRHPNAHDLQAGREVHFGHDLLEVTFKDNDKESRLELFRADGHLFTDELPLTGLGEAPPAVKDALDKAFPGYVLKKAELITNPNGPGEEYEVYLEVDGINWKVSVNEKGDIAGKDHF